jgi:hypothetical protein
VREYDLMLYEDAGHMVEYVAQALKRTSMEAAILFYSPAPYLRLQKMTQLTDLMFCIYS